MVGDDAKNGHSEFPSHAAKYCPRRAFARVFMPKITAAYGAQVWIRLLGQASDSDQTKSQSQATLFSEGTLSPGALWPASTRAEGGFILSTIDVGIRIVVPRSFVVS
jgi:hypothetical protein